MDSTINVDQTVELIMEHKERLKIKQYNAKLDSITSSISTYGEFQSALETLKTNVSNVKKSFNAVSFTTADSDKTVVQSTITNTANLYGATHKLVVTSLASPETLASANAVASRSTALNMSGNLIFTTGSEHFAINTNANDSLEVIRDRINNSTFNTGVIASIQASTNNGADEYTLVVSGTKPGVDNKLVITGSLESTFDFSTELSVATNAEFTFDNKTVSRNSNTISDVVDGISFTLLATGSSDIKVNADAGSQIKGVKDALVDMVSSYNMLLDTITKNKMNSDPSVRMIKGLVKDTLFGETAGLGDIKSLLEMGIKLAPYKKTLSVEDYAENGKIKIDDKALDNALSDKLSSIKNFFTDGTNGFIKQFSNTVDEITKAKGILPGKLTYLNAERRKLDSILIPKEEQRLADVFIALKIQYGKLNAMLSRSDKMTDYITQQFSKKSS